MLDEKKKYINVNIEHGKLTDHCSSKLSITKQNQNKTKKHI